MSQNFAVTAAAIGFIVSYAVATLTMTTYGYTDLTANLIGIPVSAFAGGITGLLWVASPLPNHNDPLGASGGEK